MRIDFDANGVPGFLADNPAEAFYALGVVHARLRPLQTLLLHTAARGELAQRILPVPALVGLDALVRRLDLPRIGVREAEKLDAETALRIDRYLAGIAGARSWALTALGVSVPPTTRATVCSALAVSAYLGLAQGQERMERAIVEALAEGASHALLERMFAPNLAGWSPEQLRALPRTSRPGFADAAMMHSGGSNAWAVAGTRTASGHAMLCGDPHLQINQHPGILCEIRARIADDYWLGATIPGLPGLALGRNRNVAWSGTFACADNVDFSIEDEAGERREEILQRRFTAPQKLNFTDGPRGSFVNERLAVRWAGREGIAECLAAYVRLPFAKSSEEADAILQRANTLSLHFVIADRSGDVRYRQVGRIPKRDYSGLYPREKNEWTGLATLPAHHAEDGIIASANEARLSPGGHNLATMPQPPYRLRRITELLAQRRDHDAQSMRAIQCDLLSLQHARLTPYFLKALPESAFRQTLEKWNGDYRDEHAAACFEQAYLAARLALAPELGGAWWEHMLEQSELPVWWCKAIDSELASEMTAKRADRFRLKLGQCERPSPQWRQPHLIFGNLNGRGPFPLRGSRATIWQGYNINVDGTGITVGPAYRFITDLGEDSAYTMTPDDIDGYLASRYKRITPP